MHGVGNGKLEKLVTRFQSYTKEKDDLMKRLGNPQVKKRETREGRLLALDVRLIPGLRDQITTKFCI